MATANGNITQSTGDDDVADVSGSSESGFRVRVYGCGGGGGSRGSRGDGRTSDLCPPVIGRRHARK